MKYLDRFFQPKDWEEKSFTSKSGKNIRYGHAEPAGEKKGTVIITTGYADFIESHHETIHEYLQRGYAVWMMDWAGQGGSEKKRDDTQRAQLLEDHVQDLHQFRNEIVQPAAGKPVFMSTHSMGGQIGLHYISKYPNDFDGAVMAAPLVDFNLKGMTRSVLQAAFRSAVQFGMGNHTIKDGRRSITRQILNERKKLRAENPVRMDLHRTFFLMNQQLRAEDPTYGLVDSLFAGVERINDKKALRAIKTAILIGIAGKDDLVNNEAIEHALKHLSAATSARLPEATHDMWHERQQYRLEWWKHVDAFLAARHAQFTPKTPASPINDNDATDKPPALAAAPQKPKGPF